MSDVAKWALLVAGAVAVIGLILALPFVEFIDAGEYANLVTSVVVVAGNAFSFARGLINNFLTPFGRTALSGLLYWMFGKWVITIGIKVTVWAYHFIFK